MNIYIKALIITLIVFSLGVYIGLEIGKTKMNEIQTGVNDLKSSIEEVELEFLFLDTMGNTEISCNYFNEEAKRLGDIAGKLGKEVEIYENSKKLDESSFSELKKEYTLILIKNWLTIEKIKKSCEGDYVTVLYFYSNTNCNKCEDQGIILSYYKEKLNKKLQVFAIDGDLNLNLVRALKESYNITEYPTLIVDNEVHKGYFDKEEVKEILCSKQNFYFC